MANLVMEGRVLAGKYELVKLLGQGGMGAVYEARNHLGKRFAVKLLLKPEFAEDPGLTARFFREAKASAAIESEHIVEVYDTGVDPETNFPFIIMELLKGEDLEHTIARVGALNCVGAARVIMQAANGLGRAHETGIVHRDIKPANIFMTARESGDSVVKILDFGIAKQTMEALASNEGAGLTKTGSMLGTPLYMSPEQAQGLKTMDGRTDLWSLGMCLYEALSGRTPWGDVDTLGALILSICSRDVTPLQDLAPWVPPELAKVVHWTLLRDQGQRCPNARALVDALRPFAGGSSQITPEVLLGVEEAARAQVAARAEMPSNPSVTATSSSVVLTSSSTSQTREIDSKKKGSVAPIIAAIAVFGIVVVGGGVFAATQLGKKDEPKGAAIAATTADTTAVKVPVPTPTVEAPPAEKTGTVAVKAPKGATIKIGNKEAKLEDGKLKLTGMPGQMYIVNIDMAGKPNFMQVVYMTEDGPTPNSIDTAEGPVVVQKPVAGKKPAVAGTSTGGAAAPPPPTGGGGAAAPPPPPKEKPKPKVETTFE